jgi:hypothetical protein
VCGEAGQAAAHAESAPREQRHARAAPKRLGI